MKLAKVINKPKRLSGAEIRFLRGKRTVADLATLMGVKVGQLERWESGDQAIGAANDRLLRLLTHVLGNGRSGYKLPPPKGIG